MQRIKKHLFIVGILFLSLILTGCSSYHAIQVQQENSDNSVSYKMDPPLNNGDKIKYTLKNGERGDATVTTVQPTSILAASGSIIPLKEVVSLEKKTISKGKTAAFVGGSVVLTGVVIIAAIVGTVGMGIAAAAG